MGGPRISQHGAGAKHDDAPLTITRLDRPSHGLSTSAVHRLRSLIEQRCQGAWQVGDLLIECYGAPCGPGQADGSRRKLEALADTVGCSVNWLIVCRLTSGAWPRKERRLGVSHHVFRALAARPDRVVVLDQFLTHCRLGGVTPSVARLTTFLDSDVGVDRTGPRPGRSRLDPVDRLARQALALDRDALERLVARLSEALAAEAAA